MPGVAVLELNTYGICPICRGFEGGNHERTRKHVSVVVLQRREQLWQEGWKQAVFRSQFVKGTPAAPQRQEHTGLRGRETYVHTWTRPWVLVLGDLMPKSGPRRFIGIRDRRALIAMVVDEPETLLAMEAAMKLGELKAREALPQFFPSLRAWL
jgi:hypothetical protein